MSNNETKYSSSKKKPGKTKAFFICLIIASFLWLVHSLNTVYTHTFKIPVAFKNLPSHKRPVIPIPEILTVDVKASGLKLAMMLLSKSNEQLELDFNTLKAINRNLNYVLSASNINFKPALGFETQIRHISPDTIYFSEKTGFQKNVALKIPLYIKCRQGYAYKKPEISPAFVTIFGDTTDIEKTDTIYTQPVTLNDVSQSVSLKPLLVKPKPGIHTNVNEANIFIEVEKLLEQSITIPISDVQSRRNRASIFPAFVKVKFTSIQNNFDMKDTSLFRATINSEKINHATHKCEVFLSTVPGHVTIMDVEPKEVEIMIMKKQ